MDRSRPSWPASVATNTLSSWWAFMRLRIFRTAPSGWAHPPCAPRWVFPPPGGRPGMGEPPQARAQLDLARGTKLAELVTGRQDSGLMGSVPGLITNVLRFR